VSLPAASARFDHRGLAGPFDIVGDVHGCADELVELLSRLGYRVELAGRGAGRRAVVAPPPGRRAVFLGDLADRGPAAPDALRIVMAMVEGGIGWCVPGNHDDKLLRWLAGNNVKPTHGLDVTIAQLAGEPDDFKRRTAEFLRSLPSYLWLDGGRLVVAHAGIRTEMIGRHDGRIRSFCLYGDTDGASDAQGLVIRYDWASRDAGGKGFVVYGHIPVEDPAWINESVCIDTGCCFGGRLTALRWPEREVVSVPARRCYAERRRPFGLPDPRPAAAS
jgi:protein phosphatase